MIKGKKKFSGLLSKIEWVFVNWSKNRQIVEEKFLKLTHWCKSNYINFLHINLQCRNKAAQKTVCFNLITVRPVSYPQKVSCSEPTNFYPQNL